MSALYVFALTGQSAPALRHGQRRIEFIDVGGVHAAVARTAVRPAVSEAALRAQHEIVMKIAERVDAILPARFGALVDRAELEALVALRREPIAKTLQLVSGRVQMTVRLFTPETRGARRAVIQRPRGAPRAPSGTEYLAGRRREIAADLTGEAAQISRALHGLVQEERRQRGQGRVDWTLYHLVDRSLVSSYERAIAPFESSITVTGPWPPFAFVPDLWP